MGISSRLPTCSLRGNVFLQGHIPDAFLSRKLGFTLGPDGTELHTVAAPRLCVSSQRLTVLS